MEETQPELKVEAEEGPKLEVLTEAAPQDQPNIVQRLRDNTNKFLDKVSAYEGSKRQLQAVLAALAIHPFNERPFNWGYPAQRELYELGLMVASDKLLFLHLGIEQERIAKEIKAKTEKPVFTIEETGLYRNGQLFDSSLTKTEDSEFKTENDKLFLYRSGSKYKVDNTGIQVINQTTKETENG